MIYLEVFSTRVYFDNGATTRVDPEVLETMEPYFIGQYGNPSSLHTFGREAGDAIHKARTTVARLIGATPDEIYFTSGGTESDNLAIKGIVTGCTGGRPHIITSRIEHPAILETCRHLEECNHATVTYLPVDRNGLVNPEALGQAITDKTALITIMHANNEIGTIEPIEELSKIAKEKGIPFHTDAVQSAGKVPLDVNAMGIDMLSLSSHKIHGPKGVGALYIRKGLKTESLMHGGGQEKGMRSGTENIPGIVGMGKACELLCSRMERDVEKITTLRDKIVRGVLSDIEESHLNGHPVKRLPNNCSFRFFAIEGESLVLSLDNRGIACSTGSACSTKKLEPSHVLLAIGLSEIEAHGSLRVTLSRESTDEEASYFLAELPPVVKRLREISPLWTKK